MLPGVELARRRRVHYHGDAAASSVGAGEHHHHHYAHGHAHRAGAVAGPALAARIRLEEKLRGAALPPSTSPSRWSRLMGEREGRATSGRRGRRERQQQEEQAERGMILQAPGAGSELWPLRPPAPTTSATIRVAVPPPESACGHRRSELTRTLSMVDVCAVCLDEVRERQESVTRLPCSHKYHSECVLPWLAIHPDCPCCRALVPSVDTLVPLYAKSMAMLVAVTCLARRRRMHCRRGRDTAAALELEQRQYGPGDQRHRWRAEPAPSGLTGREENSRLPRAPLPHASSNRQQGRRPLPLDGGPALGCRRRRQTVGAGAAVPAPTQEEARSQQQGPGSSAAVGLEEAPATGAARAEAETGSVPSSEASCVLCAVCLEEVRRGRGEAALVAAEATTLPCSHSYHPGCVLPWLAAHGACPCCRATVTSPENLIITDLRYNGSEAF
ncbi:hypothetical protein BAE44_0003591 [Dichanthelium oligosanthes]|uniref:RING-type domain-containing protein n=1 Tax=Dichanthelium oligosanthes TaxID=888268 RepID=A0A1E5WDV2_9POAL|nr:hypothetical protein BAE44_0003591 [Dichanthelium oligosanthes]